MPTPLTLAKRNLRKDSRKVASGADVFDLPSTLPSLETTKVPQSYVGACAVLGILKFSYSISQIFNS